MVDCEVDEQVRRIDNPNRLARLKGSDPDGYLHHGYSTKLFQSPPEEMVRSDTTNIAPKENAMRIYEVLLSRGLRPLGA